MQVDYNKWCANTIIHSYQATNHYVMGDFRIKSLTIWSESAIIKITYNIAGYDGN